MSNVIQGVKSAIQQPSSYGYIPGRGYHSRLRWKITNPSDIPALLGQLIAAGYSYDVSPEADGAVTVVEATSQPASDTNGDPATTPLAEIWERDSVTTEKELIESSIFNSIATYQKSEIKKAAESGSRSLPTYVDTADKLTLYNLIAAGVKTVRVSSPLVRRTRITASSYTVKASDTNMGKILSTAQMTSLELAPSTVLFSLPASGSATGADGVAKTSGWYKKPAKVSQQGDGRWQIVQEYEFDLWATAIYSLAS